MNGYFQLINDESGTGMMLYPATDGGMDLDISEMIDYLVFKSITYDLTKLYADVKSFRNEPLMIRLNNTRGLPQQEMVKVYVASDNMSAVARFYAPSNDGEAMDKREIMNDLRHRGVTYGVLEEEIVRFIGQREYCKDILIAEGTKSDSGTDAKIIFLFNTDVKVRPTLQEDGSVDFFHLNTINHCKAGDVLARLEPEVPSSPGINVRGEMLPGREIKRKRLQYGRNIELSEDGKEIRSLVNGHATCIEGKVFVSDLLELTNVDNSTGNIDYEGSILVNGNVCENFSVKANGNIEVKGVVEGALVEAGGDVIIVRGMNGMGKGIIKAGGNVVAKFLENAQVNAGGYVETDSILHCKVMAKDEINVGGKRGFITGGVVCATNGVHVKMLGSSMGADTVVEVGADPSVKQKIQELQQTIMECGKVIKSTQPILNSMAEKLSKGVKLTPEQMEYLKNVNTLHKMKQEEMETASNELDEVQHLLESNKNVSVIVSGDVYAGTRIVIGDVSMIVKNNMRYCRFVKERGDVKMKAL